MDKDSCSTDPERREKAAFLDAARSLDPASLFPYWPRGDSGTSAATNALFGAYGAANPLVSGRGSYGNSGNSVSVPSSAAAYGNTLSVAASQAASLGINPASAAWWTVASHLAAQDYLARLHGMSFAGLHGAEALYPNFLLSPTAHNSSHLGKSSSKSNSTMSSSSSSKSQSLSFDKEKENWSSAEKERDKEREREKERERLREREREKERLREREREREKEKSKDLLMGKSLGSSSASSSKAADHLASIAALANSGTTVSPFPPQAHSSSSADSIGVLGGVRLPPDTEIIKYTSSIGGPKIPGTTNRGRKKTISLDPPSVSVMPTHSSTGIPIEFGQPFKSQSSSNAEGLDHVEVIKLPAHSSSNGIVPPSSDACDEAPLNLCTKSRNKEEPNIEKDRISRRKPVPKQRRPVTTDPNPITSLSAMSQLFTSEVHTPPPAEEDSDSSLKDGRPRNLGRGVSKPKKNTVASLLAQSRALGLKGALPGDFVSQLAALKTNLPPDISSQLNLLQNLQSTVEDVASDGGDKRSQTPDNSANFEDKSQVKTSEDGSFTTDSASTGGSDSESEGGSKITKKKEKEKKEVIQQPEVLIKSHEKVVTPVEKVKEDPPKETKSPLPNSVDEQLLYTQEINKQKELLYAVELEKERRRQHMILVRSLENRKKIEERERRRIEIRAEKIAKHEKRLEQRRIELELLKELRRPTEDMELEDLKPLPEISRIPGLKLSGQAFADTLMVFEFLHNFGETLGFDMDSLPTLNSLQGALLNDEENEEELLSIMTHLLVCAIEDPGIPNPARHITLLGQSLKQADITHTNISEILRIYLYANATGEVKALTGLNFERDREKKISEHHNLYGEEAQSQNTGKNAAFFENLYENPTYKLSEELKEKPFLALNPTTKSAILAFICNELLQNKAVLRQIEGSLETVILSRKERWVLDQSIRKLRCLHDRQVKYSSYFNKDIIKENNMATIVTPQPVNANAISNEKEKNADGVDSEVESAEDSDHESEITQPEEFQDEQQQNLNSEEISKRLEKLLKQQESHLVTLRTSNQQIRAMCLGQDRYWRRYWCLPRCGSIFVEGMESSQPEELALAEAEEEIEKMEVVTEEKEIQRDDGTQTTPLERTPENEIEEPIEKITPEANSDENEKGSKETKAERRRSSKRRGEPCEESEAKKTKTEENSTDEVANSESKVNGCSDESKMIVEDEIKKEEPEIKPSKDEENVNGHSDEPVRSNIKQEPGAAEAQKIKAEGVNESSVEDNGKTEKEGKSESVEADSKANTNEKIKEEVKDYEQEIIEIKDEVKEETVVKIKAETPDRLNKKPFPEESAKADYPMKEYLEKIKDLSEKDIDNLKDLKSMKDFLSGMGKTIENEAQLRELAEKFKFEDDPLLRAMKKELSSRIFGSTVKKEEFEDVHAYRNLGSPITNEVTICNSFTFPKENDVENYQWFSLLPKESCDSQTLMLGKNDVMKAPMAANARVKAGLPPSPGPIPLCDSPAPLILSPEEAAMLEQLKTCGPRPPPIRKPVPKHYRRGWWKVADENQLYQILECLHNRGIREKELKRLLARYLEDCVELDGKWSELKANCELVDLDISGDYDDRIKILDDGAPASDEPHSWDQQVFERVDNFMLEQVENLEDKVANASMQVKGWRVPSRSNSSDGGGSFETNCKKVKLEPIEVAKQRLISLEAAIERRYLKPPLGFSTGEGGVTVQIDQEESVPKGLGIWREAVLKSHTAAQLSMALYMLESCIAWDKSIMKANCQFCQSGDNEDKLLLCDGCDRGYHMYCFKPKMESIPDGDWFCHECKNKSNGEKNCIVCGKRPIKNFVMCEHCPRIYHADCLNPPLLKIPRAKWNCVSCAIKYPKKKCGRKVGWRKSKEAKSKEDKDHHREAHNNSVQDDKTSEQCGEAKPDERSGGEMDVEDAAPPASVKDSKEKECAPLSPIPSAACSNSAVSDDPPPLSPQQPTSVLAKKERISKKLCKELNACKNLVEEMELQDEAWPFLLPVNTKQFPTYKKIIKCPMDISTIKKRLTDGQYKTKEEFVYDVRQIFNNCETFNEDDSPVGKAGHAMRSFFETKWGELTNQKSSP